ncbi:50S ribosomal protein L25 [bacterium]|nr:50S ribosomal protein L25 [bacterium]
MSGEAAEVEQGEETGEAFTLSLTSREKSGTTSARNFRKQGYIPAVAYELGKEAIPFLLNAREFYKQASRALTSQVFTLGEGVEALTGRKVLVKEIQRDGLKGNVLHVDFLLLEEKRPSLVTVPVVVTGEAPGVKNQGGVLTTACRQITLLAPPESIPEEIVVSVDALGLGDRIRTKDLELPEGVRLKSSPEETVANVIAGRAAKLGEGEAGSEAEGAEEGEAEASGAE